MFLCAIQFFVRGYFCGLICGGTAGFPSFVPLAVQRRLSLAQAWWMVHVTERHEVTYWSRLAGVDLFGHDAAPILLSLAAPIIFGTRRGVRALRGP
jgi:hypothetical protein